MPRDDFSGKTIDLLRRRVRDQCSNPVCSAATSGPTVRTDGAVNLGVAAHIHAASPRGPRFNSSMSPEERASITNGIWLCQTCAAWVDRDVERYPANLLQKWKVEAEGRAMEELARRPKGASDAQAQAQSMFAGLPITLSPLAIGDAHQAMSEALEAVDPRFCVVTSYRDKTVMVTLRAREDVQLSLEPPTPLRTQWDRELSIFALHGGEARVPADGTRLQGSPLIEQLLAPSVLAGGQFVFKQHPKDAIIKLSVKDAGGAVLAAMDDIPARLTGGTESFAVAGTGCRGAFEAKLTSPKRTTSMGEFQLRLNTACWVGQPVDCLPFFDKLRAFFQQIAMGGTVDATIEVNGTVILGATLHVSLETQGIQAAYVMLEYTRRARVLCHYLKHPLAFQLTPPFSAEDHERLAEAVDIIEGEAPVRGDAVGKITSNVIADQKAENIKYLVAGSVLRELVFLGEPTLLRVFDTQLILPGLRVVFSNVMCALSVCPDTVREGDAVPVQWIPGADFSMTRTFESLGSEVPP